jgi:tripartite-type tricarboxylate transporter receptor subunit TctC
MKPICLILLPVLGLGFAAMGAGAQTWPTKPLRAVVPVGAGSTADTIPRLVFEQLSPQRGQSTVVENRPGAGVTIGTAFVAKADPDGYTILATGNAHTPSAVALSNLSYHPACDFAAVAARHFAAGNGRIAGEGLTTGRSRRAAKAKPGAFNFLGRCRDRGHLAAERFGSAKVEAVHNRSRVRKQCLMIAGRVILSSGRVPRPAACPRASSRRLW